MAIYHVLSVLAFFFSIAAVYGGDFCYDYMDSETKYCTYGCCGTLNEYCCTANVALIVGMTFLAIIIVSVIIVIICCVRRRQAAPGAIITTQPATTGYVVTTGHNASTVTTMGQPMGTYAYGTPIPGQGAYAPPPTSQPYAYGAPGAMAPPAYNTVVGSGVDNTGYKQ